MPIARGAILAPVGGDKAGLVADKISRAAWAGRTGRADALPDVSCSGSQPSMGCDRQLILRDNSLGLLLLPSNSF